MKLSWKSKQVSTSSRDQCWSSVGGSGKGSVGGAWNKRKKRFTAPSAIVELMRYYSNPPPIATQIADHNLISPIDRNPRPLHQIPNDETNRIIMQHKMRTHQHIGLLST
ncbi:hypothetical protein PIB30_071983 [Stylosanthes scabra]|uniref:Uncharacterized protein n=1 Tax=Stylosanthes scabra TaxID=79078 RepID=A0ABU6VQ01_9FABA|nr:hypothetical protein [Stylosanthes scabra]